MRRRIVRVPSLHRSFLDLGAHGCVPFLVADRADQSLEDFATCAKPVVANWRFSRVRLIAEGVGR
jgi:hypothetical protein